MSPRVLIVEDERDIADLMSLHLRREGHDVTTVENGEDALRILSNPPGASAPPPYQLLVLDWMLPGVSGLELCKKIRGEKAEATPAACRS